MPRFFVKNNQINNDKITIIDEDVKHIKNVLRKQIGDKIEVCNQDTGNSLPKKAILKSMLSFVTIGAAAS